MAVGMKDTYNTYRVVMTEENCGWEPEIKADTFFLNADPPAYNFVADAHFVASFPIAQVRGVVRVRNRDTKEEATV